MFQNAMFEQGAMPTLTRAIGFAEQRQKLIANNIANAETAGYQAQDLPEARFKLRLKEAILNRRYGNPRHYRFRDDYRMNDNTGFMRIKSESNYRGVMKHSKNNVDIDMENAKMASNAMYHSTLTNLLSSQFDKLTSAIAGRV